jgi:hypothetical protein
MKAFTRSASGDSLFVVSSPGPGRTHFQGVTGPSTPGRGAAVDKVNGMSQERKSFTVNDRRHFTSEGEPREEPGDAPADAQPPPPEPPPVEGPVDAASAASPAEASGGSSRARRGGDAGQEFGPFIVSLATQAGYLLAAEGENAAASLEDARHLIAIIEMLKDKTEGRRTPSEDQILDTVLYELRMGYVSRTRAGGA